MVQKRVDSFSALKSIDGVGEGRIEKYGQVFLEALAGNPS